MKMPENNINSNQLDAFSEKIKSKLENHQLPVDAEWWNAIEKGITAKKKRKIPAWLWIPLGSAAVIALVFTFHLPSELKTIAVEREIKPTNSKRPEISSNINTIIYNSKIKTEKSIIHKNLVDKKIGNEPIGLASTISQIANNTIDSTKYLTEIVKSISNEAANGDIPVVKIDSSSTLKRIEYLASNFPNKPLKNKIYKKTHNWELAAALGSGGNGVPTTSNNYYLVSAVNDNKTIVNATTTYTSIMSPSNFTKISFSVPISVGLIGRLNLDKTISVESGLVYTFLQTNYKNTTLYSPDAQLNLHYVGIPLNLIVKFWSNPTWEIYISGGGMLEKGIRSVYVQHSYSGNQTTTTTAATPIDGFQTSINGAFGTTYKLRKNLGIFFEPKISYFFNNNQPASARTDQPTTIGLTAGVRYEFK
jgi:hypothetical protein